MTSYGAMSAAGLRVLDLRVDMGVLARITPESAAAYEQRQAAGTAGQAS